MKSSVEQFERDLARCLDLAGRMLGMEALPLLLDWELEQILRPRLRLEQRWGLGDGPPLMNIDDSRRGHRLWAGMERFRVALDGPSILVVRVELPYASTVPDFWAVGRDDHRRLYRYLRWQYRRRGRFEAPLLPADVRQRLWDNTVGLLLRGQRILSRYGVALKRGVLLLGEPGNGKTMACRWLRAECQQRRLAFKSVSAADYQSACNDGELDELFSLASPGLVYFDDFDAALADRSRGGDSPQHNTFLTQLDGMSPKQGAVYVFTTNKRLNQLDPAFRRPGRIDVWIQFRRPDAAGRAELIRRTWHEDIQQAIDLEGLVAASDGFSFAELAEVKKLMVMDYLDRGRWNWQSACEAVRQLALAETNPSIGFAASDAKPRRRLQPTLAG